MKSPNPFRLPKLNMRLDTFSAAMKDSLKQPYIGLTQGGSSRKNGGARVAAVVSKVKPNKEN